MYYQAALLFAWICVASSPLKATTARETLLSSDLRPTMTAFISAFEGRVPDENPFNPGPWAKEIQGFVNALPSKGPTFVVQLEIAFPGATFAFPGRDAAWVGEILEAFYLVTEQPNRVFYPPLSSQSITHGLEKVLPIFQKYGFRVVEDGHELPTYVIVDGTRWAKDGQGQAYLGQLYQAYPTRDFRELIESINVVGVRRDKDVQHPPIKWTAVHWINNYFSTPSLSGKRIPETVLYAENAFFNQDMKIHWHEPFQAPGQDLEPQHGPHSQESIREAILFYQWEVYHTVFRKEFRDAVIQYANERFGIPFPQTTEDHSRLRRTVLPGFRQRYLNSIINSFVFKDGTLDSNSATLLHTVFDEARRIGGGLGFRLVLRDFISMVANREAAEQSAIWYFLVMETDLKLAQSPSKEETRKDLWFQEIGKPGVISEEWVRDQLFKEYELGLENGLFQRVVPLLERSQAIITFAKTKLILSSPDLQTASERALLMEGQQDKPLKNVLSVLIPFLSVDERNVEPMLSTESIHQLSRFTLSTMPDLIALPTLDREKQIASILGNRSIPVTVAMKTAVSRFFVESAKDDTTLVERYRSMEASFGNLPHELLAKAVAAHEAPGEFRGLLRAFYMGGQPARATYLSMGFQEARTIDEFRQVFSVLGTLVDPKDPALDSNYEGAFSRYLALAPDLDVLREDYQKLRECKFGSRWANTFATLLLATPMEIGSFEDRLAMITEVERHNTKKHLAVLKAKRTWSFYASVFHPDSTHVRRVLDQTAGLGDDSAEIQLQIATQVLLHTDNRDLFLEQLSTIRHLSSHTGTTLFTIPQFRLQLSRLRIGVEFFLELFLEERLNPKERDTVITELLQFDLVGDRAQLRSLKPPSFLSPRSSELQVELGLFCSAHPSPLKKFWRACLALLTLDGMRP